MQTKTQLLNKKNELEFWLTHNPSHENRPLIEADLREVNHKLANKSYHE